MALVRLREIGIAVLSGLVILAVSLALGEILIRIVNPNPRVQIVREDRILKMQCLDGTAVWEEWSSRQNLDCIEAHPDARRIVVVGSSILYGSGQAWMDVFSQILQARLNSVAPEPGFCVINLAQPAFTFDQKLAIASQYLNELRPELVLWEVWQNDLSEYVVVGEAAYNLHGLILDESGMPNVFGLPFAVNRWLFVNLRLYEYSMLALAHRRFPETDSWRRFVNEKLPRATALVKASGAKMALVACPWLDRPFPSTAIKPPDYYGPIIKFAESAGILTIRLEQVLIDQNVEDVRMDTCCHYNATGHHVIGERLANEVWDLINVQ